VVTDIIREMNTTNYEKSEKSYLKNKKGDVFMIHRILGRDKLQQM